MTPILLQDGKITVCDGVVANPDETDLDCFCAPPPVSVCPAPVGGCAACPPNTRVITATMEAVVDPGGPCETTWPVICSGGGPCFQNPAGHLSYAVFPQANCPGNPDPPPCTGAGQPWFSQLGVGCNEDQPDGIAIWRARCVVGVDQFYNVVIEGVINVVDGQDCVPLGSYPITLYQGFGFPVPTLTGPATISVA